jgi:predicted nucleotide-binding protein (sugar kinase/HSP70/actin superfamily)
MPQPTHSPTVTHYSAFKSRPFTEEDRKNVTILFGGLTWKHERLVQGVMHNLKYKAEPLPNIAREDLDAGKELIDVGACCPTIFTTGNLVTFLKKQSATSGKKEVADRYLFLTAGACGPCRFGQYHESYAMALDGLGLRDFRLMLLAQDKFDQGPTAGGGLQINLPMSLGLVFSILSADVLGDLEYMTRPYETTPGQTDEVLKDSVEHLYRAFRDRPLQRGKLTTLGWHLFGAYFTRALREVRRRWDAVEVDRLRVKPRVKITGEFWLQTHEGDGNYNIKRWLEQENAEVVPPPVAVWLDYLLDAEHRRVERRRRSGDDSLAANLGASAIARLYRGTYARLRKAMGGLASELPDQAELRRLAEPFYHFELGGGEGHMLIGKALYAYHHKKAHMLCELSPYACMPNTMSIGSMANVIGKYPDLLYAPIEVKGDAEVHALSRCQMILTEAKKRAQAEFEGALEESGVTIEQIREWEAAHPEVRRATYRVPHRGCCGTAANYVLHLARDRGLARRRSTSRGRATANGAGARAAYGK